MSRGGSVMLANVSTAFKIFSIIFPPNLFFLFLVPPFCQKCTIEEKSV